MNWILIGVMIIGVVGLGYWLIFGGDDYMNQKFGDLFQKVLVVYFVWACIAFIFGIGY